MANKWGIVGAPPAQSFALPGLMYPVRPVGPPDDSPGRNPGRWMIARGETLGAGGHPYLFVEPFPFDYINPPLLLAPSPPLTGDVW